MTQPVGNAESRLRRWQRRRHLAAEESVLAALRSGARYGYDIWKASSVRSGRMYPALARLEADGLIRSYFDDVSGRRAYSVNTPYQSGGTNA